LIIRQAKTASPIKAFRSISGPWKIAKSPSTPPLPPGVGIIKKARFMARLRRKDNISLAGSRLNTTIVGNAIRHSHDIVEKKKVFNRKLVGFLRSSCEYSTRLSTSPITLLLQRRKRGSLKIQLTTFFIVSGLINTP